MKYKSLPIFLFIIVVIFQVATHLVQGSVNTLLGTNGTLQVNYSFETTLQFRPSTMILKSRL